MVALQLPMRYPRPKFQTLEVNVKVHNDVIRQVD